MVGLFLLAGCATMDSRSGGQGPSPEVLGKIRPGVTTAGEVKALLGPPIRVARFDRMDRDVWEYRQYNDPMSEYHIAVQFSADGVVRELLALKDYSREPCGP
jgi:outer membrane protein assembly factor BamE (lipoprotein component of BamABCDE complex)